MTAVLDLLSDTATAFAYELGAAGLGLTWRDYGDEYEAGEWGLYPFELPPDGGPGSLDVSDAVACAAYPLTHDAALSMSELGVQFIVRAGGEDPRRAWAMDSAITAHLTGMHGLVLPVAASGRALAVVQVQYSSGASLGRDTQRRCLRSINFTAGLDWQTPNRH